VVECAFKLWGKSINPADHELHITAIDNEQILGDPKELLNAPHDKKFYVLDGQHQVQVLCKAIWLQIAQERGKRGEENHEVTTEEVDGHPRAQWPAQIFY
jgi:hypothetical protein